MKADKQYTFQIGAYNAESKLITHYAISIDTLKELVTDTPKRIKQVLENLINGNEAMSKQYSEQIAAATASEAKKEEVIQEEQIAEVEIDSL